MVCIYSVIYYDYSNDYAAYALGAYFLFPFAMVILPFFLGVVLKISNKPLPVLISNSMFVCVISAGIFITVFNHYTFGIVDFLGIQKNY